MSQIATTIEQSKRLLDAGLDSGSADMMWRNVALTYDFGHAMEVATAEPILYAFNAKSEDSIPAWSLSRLIDILGDFNYGPMNNGSEMVMECIVMAIEADIEFGPKRINEKYLKK